MLCIICQPVTYYVNRFTCSTCQQSNFSVCVRFGRMCTWCICRLIVCFIRAKWRLFYCCVDGLLLAGGKFIVIASTKKIFVFIAFGHMDGRYSFICMYMYKYIVIDNIHKKVEISIFVCFDNYFVRLSGVIKLHNSRVCLWYRNR